MALKGNLSNFRLGDLLQTLTQNQTWGILRLERSGERRDLVVSPYGVAILDLSSVARTRIEERLAHRGLLDKQGLTFLRARENAKKPLSELLTQIPSVTTDALRAVLEAEASEQIQGLIEWTDGTFEVVEGDAPNENTAGPAPRDTAGLVFEAARRQDERTALGDKFPHPEDRYRTVGEVDPAALDDAEREFFAALDGGLPLRAIADKTTGDFFTTAKTAANLEVKGLVRRLEWQELVELSETLTASNSSEAALGILGFLESWTTITDAAPFIELAEHRKALGDNEGAARCFVKAADLFVKSMGDPNSDKSAADCMAQAVALAPKDVNYRERRVDIVRALGVSEPELVYETTRDWLLVCADRGDVSKVDVLERELLTILPTSADEESKVGRALGQLGRKTTAAQLLCRAAKRRLKARNQEQAAASEFKEALRFVNNYPEARKGLAKLDGRRVGRRRAGIAMLVAVIGLTFAIAFPIRNNFRDRDQADKLAHAERMLDRGDVAEALAYLDIHEGQITSPGLLERCQQIRTTAAKKSDERRQQEQSESDVWTREQFTRAADAMDAKDYATAAFIYASILDRGFDENKLKLVGQRLRMIERKLVLEQKRVEGLCRSLASKTKSALKMAVENSQTALTELETLVSSQRHEELDKLLARLPGSTLERALEPEEVTRLTEAIRTANAVFARGLDLQQMLSRQQTEARELNELEAYLLTARRAESDGDSAAALEAFETLSTRYKGTALRSYIDDRVKLWKSVKGALEAHSNALARGDLDGARAQLDKAKSLSPNVKVGSLDVAFEFDSLPTGASVHMDGELVGKCPVKIKFPSGKTPKIEARLDGFETRVCSVDQLTSGRTVFSLVPKPQWNLDMGSSASGQGLYAHDQWFLADRHGTVRSIGSDGTPR